ncbi:HI_0552 family protein [Streptococcus cameli]
MGTAMKEYLAYQGVRYVKPEKAGELTSTMIELKKLAQAARKEFETIGKALESQVSPFQMERVSQWMNQGQICRPHFWVYYRLPSDAVTDVALAIRLYGDQKDFGISVEVSFVERKKSDQTLEKQARVLEVPIEAPLYYLAQEQGESIVYSGDENNRQVLKGKLAAGMVRKVLVKKEVSIQENKTLESITQELRLAFEQLLPYYQVTK